MLHDQYYPINLPQGSSFESLSVSQLAPGGHGPTYCSPGTLTKLDDSPDASSDL